MSEPVRKHPRPADLRRYIVSPWDSDPRAVAVRSHVQACAVCSLVARRLAAIPREQLDRVRVFPVRSDWIAPCRLGMLAPDVRGGGLEDQKLHYEAGPFKVELILREYPSAPEFEIIGRITRGGGRPVAGLDLELLEAQSDVAVACASTDDFGEFDTFASKEGSFGLRLGRTRAAPCVLIWHGIGFLPRPGDVQWT